MGRSADRLLRLIYEWLDEAKECSSNLRDLAEELESLRKDCNTWENLGNTLAVVGSLVSVCAAPFTGGASLAAAGALAGGIGTGVSVVTKITEQFKSSSKLEKVKEIDKRCNRIADELQELFEDLREQCPSSSREERDKHVMKEFLKAMSRRSGLDSDIDIKDLDDLIKHLMDNALVNTITKRLASSLITEVLSVLSVFSLELDGVLLSLAISNGRKQIGKAVVKQGASRVEGALVSAAVSTGGKQVGKAAAIKGASRFLGGVVGLAFSLPDAIDSWTEAIEDKHETKASTSLRDTARTINKTRDRLSTKLVVITKLLTKTVKRTRTNSDSSDSSSDDEEELKLALVNARSVNKFIRPKDSSLIDLIQSDGVDVLLITETWLKLDSIRNGDFRKILPLDFNFINDPRFYGRGGGVAIVYSPAFSGRHVHFDFTFRFEYSAASLRRLPVPTRRLRKPKSMLREPILILCIYRPPAHTYTEFFDELSTLLSMAYKSFRLVIIGGDFNIWVDCPDLKESCDFQAVLNTFGLVQYVHEPTHTKGHTLDLVIARPDVRISSLSVRPNHFSDHKTIFFTAKTNVNLTIPF